MKHTKKLLALLLAGVMVCTSGCGLNAYISIDEDGNETVTAEKVYYTDEEIRSLCVDENDEFDEEAYNKEIAELTQETYNGETYYVENATEEPEEEGTIKENGGFFTSSRFEMPNATYGLDSDDLALTSAMFEMADFVNYVITFPKKVLAANGDISEDGYTVTYPVSQLYAKSPKSGFRLYAAFTNNAINNTGITINGVANGKTYSTNKTFSVSTYGTITDLKVNGRSVEGRGTTLSKNGSYTLTVKLLSGATKTVKFSIKKYYKITYKVNGGKALKSSTKKVRYGSKYGKLATPTRKGYKFLGWYTKKSGGTRKYSTSVCKGNITLYAHWKKK